MTDTTITLDSSRDSITFTPTGADVDIFGAAPVGGAFIYRDECLDDWYALPKPTITLAKRANAHGAFGLGQTFTDAATPSVIGRYHGLSHADAVDARERLSAMYNDGNPIVMRVTDVKGTTSRVVWVTDFDPDWTATDTFEFTMNLVAPDGRRYSPVVETPGTGLPTPPSGLVWNLGTSTRGSVYAWTGAANASSSTETTNGTLSRTNLVTNPGPRVAGWVASSGSISIESNPAFTSGQAALLQAPATGGFYILTNVFPVTGGVAYSASIEGMLGTAGVARLTIRFRNSSGGETYLSGTNRQVGAGVVTPISETITAPADAVDAAIFFDVQSGGNGAPARAGSAYLATAAGGYFDGLTPSTRLYFDWGSAGTPGTITLTNTGNATAYPTIFVGGGGVFSDGFRVTEVETGRELVFPFIVDASTVIAMNSRTRRAVQNSGGDVTELLTTRQWASVPPGATRTYLIGTLGNVTGAPTFRATMMPANL